jgi:hypothetical protein
MVPTLWKRGNEGAGEAPVGPSTSQGVEKGNPETLQVDKVEMTDEVSALEFVKNGTRRLI